MLNTKPQSSFAVYHYESKTCNLFGAFRIFSQVRQTIKSLSKDPNEVEDDDFVHTTSIRVRPAPWLTWLGIHCGFNLAFERSSDTWKHTLNTFRLVPNDAPIFSACLEGDVIRVAQLLTDGEASVWDCNDFGRTPLHVSMEYFIP